MRKVRSFAGHRYPAVAKSWRTNWERVIPFLPFSENVRKAVYTTNQIESLNSSLRRAVRRRGHFPGDDAARKLLYLALRDIAARWKEPRPTGRRRVAISRSSSANDSGSWTDGNLGWDGGAPARIRSRLEAGSGMPENRYTHPVGTGGPFTTKGGPDT